jgi:hypothetical protein
MARKTGEVMTHVPVTVNASTPRVEVAPAYARRGRRWVVDVDTGGPTARILTDRDIAVHVIADGRDPSSTPVGDVATPSPVTVLPATVCWSTGRRTERAFRLGLRRPVPGTRLRSATPLLGVQALHRHRPRSRRP